MAYKTSRSVCCAMIVKGYRNSRWPELAKAFNSSEHRDMNLSYVRSTNEHGLQGSYMRWLLNHARYKGL